MKLTLAHEIRARAIACTPLGCMGMCSPCSRCRKEPRLLFLCATAASYKLCCPLSDEFLLSLIRSHKRADARDRKSSGSEGRHPQSRCAMIYFPALASATSDDVMIGMLAVSASRARSSSSWGDARNGFARTPSLERQLHALVGELAART
eukprot:scaffold111537_cov48-Phaeocystis_antarctica.AAC.1